MNMQQDRNPQASRGFTLIEILIALVIVAIVSSFAISSYQKSVLKSNRSAAKATLTKIASGEENWRFTHNSYTATVASVSGPIPANVSTIYSFTVAATASTYSAVATAIGGQLKDTDCTTFSISSTGAQSATGNAASSCW